MSLFAALGGISPVSAAEKCCIDDRIWRFPKNCYYIFLATDPDERKRRIKHLDDDVLNKIINHSTNKDIKKESYDTLRNRAIGRRLQSSIIINEVVAACGLISNIVDYLKLTWKMKKDIGR